MAHKRGCQITEGWGQQSRADREDWDLLRCSCCGAGVGGSCLSVRPGVGVGPGFPGYAFDGYKDWRAQLDGSPGFLHWASCSRMHILVLSFSISKMGIMIASVLGKKPRGQELTHMNGTKGFLGRGTQFSNQEGLGQMGTSW